MNTLIYTISSINKCSFSLNLNYKNVVNAGDRPVQNLEKSKYNLTLKNGSLENRLKFENSNRRKKTDWKLLTVNC